MNEQQKRHYRARMPVIIPTLADTSVKHVREAAQRHFEAGAEYVLIPVFTNARCWQHQVVRAYWFNS